LKKVDKTVQLKVSDTGIGISGKENKKNKIQLIGMKNLNYCAFSIDFIELRE
jgi:signal transduction histidine kinase